MQKDSSQDIRKLFYEKKLDYAEASVSINHLWRELSHLYAGNPRRPRLRGC